MPQLGAPDAKSTPLAYQETSYGCAGFIHPFNRTPFRDSGYGAFYQGFVRSWDLDPAGLGGDNKQRKRRGKFPKETTDKLRAWFVAHLQHPYPTEDEKQELMRQTGMQMNQISNWFINARRRQLPTMISKRGSHNDAMAGARSSVVKTLERGRREPAGPPKRRRGRRLDDDLKRPSSSTGLPR
ncbi:homeodomain super [Fusarium falciforme]|nr:homeodomain super [Fusarium falciforme]